MPVYNEITICGCQENVFASCILFALKYYICGKVVKHCTKYIITKITGNMEGNKIPFIIILPKSHTLNTEIILTLRFQHVMDCKSINTLLIIFFASYE